MNNKVAIIGSDHINTLGLIRTFGENGIRVYLFLVSDSKINAVQKSRYVEKYWICENENAALEKIVEVLGDEKEKPAIIPSSDPACLCLDANYSRLKDSFIMPNIQRKGSMIYRYMDKFLQQKTVEENGIRGIKSRIISLDSPDGAASLGFPVILKPNISAEGNKEDIRICKNAEEYSSAKDELIDLGYKSILVQELIKYDFECDVQGFSVNGDTSVPGVIEKIRVYPPKRGSTTFGAAVPCGKYAAVIDGIKRIMKELEYTGIFDIDIFVSQKEDGTSDFCLNEINFRNSAISYAYGKSYIAYYWYLSCVENRFADCPPIEESYTFIDDQADLHNVLDGIITEKQHRRDMKNAKILLAKNADDKKPSRTMFVKKVLGKISHAAKRSH